MTKQCSMCREDKPLSEFNKSTKPPYYQGYCRECQKLTYAEWVAANKGKKRKAVREYQKANSSRIAIQAKRRYDNGGKERQREHIHANRDQYNSYYHAHRARKKNAEGTYDAEDIQLMLLSQSGFCNGCGKPMMPYYVDHIIPLNNSGTNWPNNLQLLCRSCNCKKSDLDWEEFLSRLDAEKVLLDDTPQLCV